MAGFVRMTNTPPVIDVDGALWSVFVSDQGADASLVIQICGGFDHDANRIPAVRNHEFDGEFHDGDLHLYLENDAAYRLLFQLQAAFDEPDRTAGLVEAMAEVIDVRANRGGEPRPNGRFCFADCADCESGST
jgi:hypothetical protein